MRYVVQKYHDKEAGEWLWAVQDTMDDSAPEAIFADLPAAEQHRDELNGGIDLTAAEQKTENV